MFERRLEVEAPSPPNTRRSELDLLREFGSPEVEGKGGTEEDDVELGMLLGPVDRVSPMEVARARSEDVTLEDAII